MMLKSASKIGKKGEFINKKVVAAETRFAQPENKNPARAGSFAKRMKDGL